MLIPFSDLLIFKQKIKGVIHVGAHELEEMRSYLQKRVKKIIWIEANPFKYKFIEEKIQSHEHMILGKIAAGCSEEKVKLNIANNGVSSSLLKFGSHKKYYPNVNFISEVEVPQMPLDKWLDSNIKDKFQYNFLNIDIQGYELEALKGMKKQLKNIDFIYMEVNFEDLYKDCPNINDIDRFLLDFNFHRVGLFKTAYKWGDAIYTRKYLLINRIYYTLYKKIFKPINRISRGLKKIRKNLFEELL